MKAKAILDVLGRHEVDAILSGEGVLVVREQARVEQERHIQDKLREHAELLRLFIEYAPVALAMFDRDMHYLVASHCWIADYSLDESNLVGRCHYEIFPDIPESWKAVHRRGMAGEVIRSDEDLFERENGSRQWLRWEVRPWEKTDGSVGGIVILSEDISERKRAAELLALQMTAVRTSEAETQRLLHELQVQRVELEAQNETMLQTERELNKEIAERKLTEVNLHAAIAEAERANNAKSRFLAAASHDLRQPLAALSLYANTLKGKAPPSLQMLASGMNDCVTVLSGMLNDLLDLSKLDAGVVKPKISDFLVFELLATLESIYSLEAQSKGFRLRIVPTRLTGRSDPMLFKRLVGNFIDNAIRYTTRGGVVIGCRRRQGKTWIEVWDSGIGIAANEKSVIFEEFKQLGDQARNQGSGLGLTIVAKTAVLLGLEINLRSWPGRGSVFAIELPLGEQETIARPTLPTSPAQALHIALVEDNPLVRDAMVVTLQGNGHQVIAAASGGALLAELGHQRPDIIISDYRLAHGETGYDVISAVRQALCAEVQAIIITGDTDPKLIARMSEQEIAVLHKPFDMEKLLAYIEEVMTQAI